MTSSDIVSRASDLHNVEVDGGASRRGANTLPVCWDGVPCVLNANVTPKRCRKRREVYEGYFGKDG